MAYVDLFKIYEVVKYISMTSHMWSGFNMLGHLSTWKGLPDDIKATIERNVTKFVRLQRQDQESQNEKARGDLAKRGLAFNDVDPAPFRRQLEGVYSTWKEKLGTKCWELLQQAIAR